MNGKPLKIAMPTPAFLPNLGGMEVGLHNIASRLIARGHNPCVIMPATHYQALKNADYKLNYQIAPFWPKMSAVTEYNPELGLKLHGLFFRQYQRRQNPDIWHSTMIYPTGTGLSYGLGNKVPILARAAGNDIQVNHDAHYGVRRNPRVDKIIRKWVGGLSAYVAITETVWQEYIALGIPQEKIYSIPNGVDISRFNRPRNRKFLQDHYGIPENSFLFLSVGRHHPKKNYAVLIEAFHILHQQNPTVRVSLAIVGEGVSSLATLVDEKCLRKHIHLIEGIGLDHNTPNCIQLPANGLIDIYKGADCFVFPSLIETFGIAIIEAMAAGLPCIISAAPGCCDITEQGAHALTFQPQDTLTLSSLMAQILFQQESRALWQMKARQRASRYDWDYIVSQYEDLYARLTEHPT